MSSLSTVLRSLDMDPGLFSMLPNKFQAAREAPESFVGPPIAQVPSTLPSSGGYLPVQGFSSGDEVKARDDPCYVEPYYPEQTLESFSPYEHNKALIYRYRQQQSVNLGSWFVHEAWMTPSVFRCAAGKKLGEIDIARGWGNRQSARFVLERHWDNFITMDDFKYLASIGINTVRLPIGFWNLPLEYCSGTPFDDVCDVYEQSWPRIIRAINMAAQSNIGVLVDLHGAVGSQNGEHHSGVSDGTVGLFDNPQYEDKTIKALVFLTEQLANVTNIVGVQVLNEPRNVPRLYDFYNRAAGAMRAISSSIPLYMHNGFDLDAFTGYVSQRSDFIVHDHHSYFVFTPSDASTPAWQHTKNVREWVHDSLAKASARQKGNLVIDEWSCGLTSDSLAGEENQSAARKDFCSAQMEVYTASTAGWSFWSYMKEDCDPGWCFKAAVGHSLPETFFSYASKGVPNSQPGTLQKKLSSWLLSSPLIKQTEILSTELSASPLDRRFSIPLLRRQNSAVSSKAYVDGFYTAVIFAQQDLSKLGFRGQFIQEAIQKLKLEGADAEVYMKSFLVGLLEGENVIEMLLASPAP